MSEPRTLFTFEGQMPIFNRMQHLARGLRAELISSRPLRPSSKERVAKPTTLSGQVMVLHGAGLRKYIVPLESSYEWASRRGKESRLQFELVKLCSSSV